MGLGSCMPREAWRLPSPQRVQGIGSWGQSWAALWPFGCRGLPAVVLCAACVLHDLLRYFSGEYGPLGSWLLYFGGQVQYHGRYGPLGAWLQYFDGPVQYNGGYEPLGAWLQYFDGPVQYNGGYGPLGAWLQYAGGQAQYGGWYGPLGACGLRAGLSQCAFAWGPYADLRDDFVWDDGDPGCQVRRLSGDRDAAGPGQGARSPWYAEAAVCGQTVGGPPYSRRLQR